MIDTNCTAHAGPLDAKRATVLSADFAHRPALRVEPAKIKHVGFAIRGN